MRTARPRCPRCRRAGNTCLCAWARPVRSDILFVILIHPREARRTIGTARLVKLCLEDTLLIEGTGESLDQNPQLQSLLSDPGIDARLLFPSPSARPVESASPETGKRLAILVVDGTWPQAKKMLRTSRLLASLPCVAFSPKRESGYQFRKQPASYCLSTIEAVHEVLTRLRPDAQPELEAPASALLEVFSRLVDQQLSAAATRAKQGHSKKSQTLEIKPVSPEFSDGLAI